MTTPLLAKAATLAARIGREVTTPAGTITLMRDGAADEDVSGKFGLGESQFEFEVDEQIVDQHRMLDALAKPADYQFDGTAVEPTERDLIVIDDGTTTRTYEVAAIPPEPAWRWSDRFNTQYRIHLKLVNEVTS